jgi:dTDP-glucose 4,6-dehydratase
MTSLRAVVTGGAGFIGSHLCRRLLADGYEVICLDNMLTGAQDNVQRLEALSGFRFVHADITDELPVTGPVDLVVHLACPASPRDYAAHPIETLSVGSLGTHQALRLADDNNARFLLASTSEVYGEPLVHPQDESYWGNVNPIGPRAVYDEAKRYAEALTAAYRRTRRTNTAIIRIFNVYGPQMRRGDGRAVPTLIEQALDGEPLTVTGDGYQTRSLCYIDDLIDGVIRMLRSDYPGPINIGNPQEITIRALAAAIVELSGSSSHIEYIPRPPDDPTRRCPDIALARQCLGWDPQVALSEGLSRTIAWFRNRSARDPAANQRRSDESVTSPTSPR